MENKLHIALNAKLSTKIIFYMSIILFCFTQVFCVFILLQSRNAHLQQVQTLYAASYKQQIWNMQSLVESFQDDIISPALRQDMMRYAIQQSIEEQKIMTEEGVEIYNNTSFQLQQGAPHKIYQYDENYEVNRESKQLILWSVVEKWNRQYVVYRLIDLSSFYEAENNILVKEVFMSLLLSILIAVISGKILQKILKPLQNLHTMTTQIANGQYDMRIPVSSQDEIGMIAEDVNRMAEKVEEKVNTLSDMIVMKNQLLGSLAHELKTPMTAIIGYADTLRKTKLSQEQQEKALYFIGAECRRLASLSAKLLELSGLQQFDFRVDSDKKAKPLEKVPLQKMLQYARKVLQKKTEEKKITLQIECNPVTVQISCEKDLFVSMLINFIENAIKASDDNGDIWVKMDDTKILIIDQGCGIPEEEIPHIKEAFYMVDKSRSRKMGGAGLGLALCDRIIAMHHMSWEISSTLGRGTTVTIWLHSVADLATT